MSELVIYVSVLCVVLVIFLLSGFVFVLGVIFVVFSLLFSDGFLCKLFLGIELVHYSAVLVVFSATQGGAIKYWHLGRGDEDDGDDSLQVLITH